MARYIDAEKVKPNDYPMFRQHLGSCCDVEEMITNCPTEDVVPIKHANWVDYKDDTMIGLYGYPYFGIRCTQCGTDPTRAHNIKYEVAIDLPYCPECGAKMDEGNNEGVKVNGKV